MIPHLQAGGKVTIVATPVSLTGQNWLITPAVDLPATGTVAGRAGANQLWLLVLTGMGTVSFSNPDHPGEWATEKFTIAPDMLAPLSSVISTPPPPGVQLGFDLLMWAPFAAVSGVTSSDSTSISGGFALDVWQPSPFIPNLLDSAGDPVPQVFQGIDVQISVLSPSEILGLSYDITLVGRIVELGHPVIGSAAGEGV